MATAKTVSELVDSINESLADNNAGLISAKDVRDNMADVAYSIPFIVASGDWESPGRQFISNVHLRTTVAQQGGIPEGGVLIVESGIQFNNSIGNGAIQVHPYPGPEGIIHGDLDALTADDHPQYINRNGARTMTGNLGMEDNWINHSGTQVASGHGIRFEHVASDEEIVHIGNETSLKFDSDLSTIHTGQSTAQAWLNFNSVSGVQGESDTLTVRSSYNITKVQRVTENGVPQAGKFKVFFTPGLFDNADEIVAIGTSNARSSNASGGDFDQNTVSCVVRTADYVTFYVQDDTNAFRDAEVNDLIVFGVPSGVTPASAPTVEYEP